MNLTYVDKLATVNNGVKYQLVRQNVFDRTESTPKFAFDIVGLHSLMIYTDLTEYNIVGDTKATLLHCFVFILKLEAGDIITNGQCMNYQTVSNLQFRPLLKISSHSIHIDLRDTSGEKIPFVSVGTTRLVLILQIYNSIGFHVHKSYLFIIFDEPPMIYGRILHCEVYHFEYFPDEFFEAPLTGPFSQGE